MTYSYAQAVEKLSEAEKNRVVAVFLSKDDPTADYTTAEWKKAAADYGSANAESMKKTLADSLKKIIATEAAEDNDVPAAGAMTAKRPKHFPYKRKVATLQEDGDEGEQAGSPVKKRGPGRPAKAKAAVKAEEEVVDAEEAETEKEVPVVQKRGRGRPTNASKGIGKGNGRGKGKMAAWRAQEAILAKYSDSEDGEQSKEEDAEAETQAGDEA